MRRGRRHERGQSLVEFILAAGLLLTLAVGTFDFGRGMALGEAASSLSRTGYRVAATSAAGDARPAILAEANGVNLSTPVLSWGLLGPNGDTVPGEGCAPAYFGANPTANACFAVGTCMFLGDGTSCNGGVTWNSRPGLSGPAAVCVSPCFSKTFPPGVTRHPGIDVRVVIRLQLAAPLLARVVSNNGIVTIQQDTIGQPLY